MKIERQFKEISELISKARNRAIAGINKELIELYWQIGQYISVRINSEEWGKSVVENLSLYIYKNHNGLNGFSPQNLWRMKQFYESYSDYPILSPLVRELSRTNNLHILSKTKSIEEREYYLRLAIKEKYSKRELERQLNSGLFERVLLSKTKLSPLVTQLKKSKNELLPPQVTLLKTSKKVKLSPPARELQKTDNKRVADLSGIFKDTYIFEFLNLPDGHSESDLQKGLISNLKNFILELGRDFTFVGENYKIQVGKRDFFIDLLFYHRELSCLVAFELKIDEFQPEYLGKINFYLEALDRDVRKPHENPSVGIILCKSKDSEVVEYALSRSLSPAMIAEYETKLIDKKLLLAKFKELSEFLE
jgi:predicted nuclease of restriction endonuclease-like (RecB) superfamily